MTNQQILPFRVRPSGSRSPTEGNPPAAPSHQFPTAGNPPSGLDSPLQEFSSPQYISKFSIGQEVVWAYVEAHDHGTILGCVWANQTSCKASGYHYLIELAPTSVSYSLPLVLR